MKLIRENFRTMESNKWADSGIVDAWAHLLNARGRLDERAEKIKYYFSTMGPVSCTNTDRFFPLICATIGYSMALVVTLTGFFARQG